MAIWPSAAISRAVSGFKMLGDALGCARSAVGRRLGPRRALTYRARPPRRRSAARVVRIAREGSSRRTIGKPSSIIDRLND
jgi:hypothetical protein